MNEHITNGDPGALGTKRLPPQHPTTLPSQTCYNRLQAQANSHHLRPHSHILTPNPSPWLIHQWALNMDPSPPPRYRSPPCKECIHIKPSGPSLPFPNQHISGLKWPTNSLPSKDPFQLPLLPIRISGTMALGLISHPKTQRRHRLHRPCLGMTAPKTWSKRARTGGQEMLTRMASAWMVGVVLGILLLKTSHLSFNTRMVI